MARRVEKMAFDRDAGLIIDGIRVVRITWPVGTHVRDDTPLRAYGPRGFIREVRSDEHSQIQNRLMRLWQLGYIRFN